MVLKKNHKIIKKRTKIDFGIVSDTLETNKQSTFKTFISDLDQRHY